MPPDIARARSFLFVPADRPERFAKAADAGADTVILDLEDAVTPAAKDKARAAAAGWLQAGGRAVLRINAPGTPWGEADAALAALPGVLAVMCPKAEPDETLAHLAAVKPVIALIETAKGVAGAQAVASTPGVIRLAFGAVDLCLELGVAERAELLLPIRLALVIHSKCAGLAPPVDGVTVELRDKAVTLEAARHARALGFGGKLCIHPAQIGPVHQGLAPEEAEIAWAHEVLAAAAASDGAAVALHGKMIDRPVVERAKQLLAQGGIG